MGQDVCRGAITGVAFFTINARFLEAARHTADHAESDLAALSLIDEQHGRRVRMSHLAFVGSHAVNGVSELHTELMRRTVFAPLHQLFPDRITNVTNGITPRRWLTAANPGLAALLSDAVGADVSNDVTRIEAALPFAEDPAFQDRFAAVRRHNKERLARHIHNELGIMVDPAMLFDAQIKRIHEYKRQLLNILETIALYNAIRAEPYQDWTPRLKLFSGKAAATYHTAKLIINLINDVATVINNDVSTRDLLKVVFLPNYNVSLAELVIPACDVSEQISTAGMEASGTGNMKFALNGAVTIGTLDGANIEIRERVGDENIFIFVKTAAEVALELQEPRATSTVIAESPYLQDVLDAVAGGAYSPGDRERYASLVRGLRPGDRFMVLNDFHAYRAAQLQLAARWTDKPSWWRMSIANTARCSWFSSDRAVGEYAARIWKTPIMAGRDPASPAL